MEGKIRQFEQLVRDAQKILVTSHISPDPDAVGSVLLLGTTIKLNYPDKQTVMVLDEQPARPLDFLSGYGNISFTNLYDTVARERPDLIIIADAMNYGRVSRLQGEQVRELTAKLKSKLIIIDHHIESALETNDVYINNQLSASVQQVYDILFSHLKLKKPNGYAETTLLGIVSDTARFKYGIKNHHETFKLVSDLIDAGASIEHLENRLNRYSVKQMQFLAVMAKNITDSGRGYTYSYVDDIYSDAAEDDKEGLKTAVEVFVNRFLRNFEANKWGFLVYPEVVEGRRTYAVSLRSINGVQNVAAIAEKLGGGGHFGAAGAKGIMASDVASAVKFVESVISGADDGD